MVGAAARAASSSRRRSLGLARRALGPVGSSQDVADPRRDDRARPGVRVVVLEVRRSPAQPPDEHHADADEEQEHDELQRTPDAGRLAVDRRVALVDLDDTVDRAVVRQRDGDEGLEQLLIRSLETVVVRAGAREDAHGLAVQRLPDPPIVGGDDARVVPLGGRIDQRPVQPPDPDGREPVVRPDHRLDQDRQVARGGTGDVPREQVGRELLLDERPREALGSCLGVRLGPSDRGTGQDDGPEQDEQEQQGGSAPQEAAVPVEDSRCLISHMPSRRLPAHASSSPHLSLGPAALRLEPERMEVSRGSGEGPLERGGEHPRKSGGTRAGGWTGPG